jgi:creatinine amidohydrolase
MRIHDLNWMQLERYLDGDDRIVLPLGSTEQHAYLSLGTDTILSERIAVEAAEPLGVPVLPSLPYGLTPRFAAYPGSPTLSEETFHAVVRELLESLYGQGFRRFLLVNGHGGNVSAEQAATVWAAGHEDAKVRFHNWWNAPGVAAVVNAVDPESGHAAWHENFPWTRLAGVEQPRTNKPRVDLSNVPDDPQAVRAALGDGCFGGPTRSPTRSSCASGRRASTRFACSSRACNQLLRLRHDPDVGLR